MVSVTVSTPGNRKINLDLVSKHPKDVTVKDLKSAIQAKIPKVRLVK